MNDLNEVRGGFREGPVMRHYPRSKKGQNLIEYALVIGLVSAAMVAMSTYVYRSVQATQKMVDEEFRNN